MHSNQNKILNRFIKIFFFLTIFVFGFYTIRRPVLADDRCGPGYVCWDSNGGSTAYYTSCRAYSSGASYYCAGGGVTTDYCDCIGSSNCTCTLPKAGDPGGSNCSEGTPYPNPDYYCYCGDSPNYNTCTTDSDCGAYSCNRDRCFNEPPVLCPLPTGTSTIGCCYGDNSSPDPSSPDPSSPPEPSPSSSPLTPYCDTKANGSDANITVSAYEQYNVSWLGMNVSSCTLNGTLTNFDGSTNYTNGPGSYVYTYSCTGSYGDCSDTVGVTVDDCVTTANVTANGSPTDITTHLDYDIAWTSTGAEGCTLYRNGSSIETTISGSRTELADTNGTFNYLLSCSNLCAASATDRRQHQSFNSRTRFTWH